MWWTGFPEPFAAAMQHADPCRCCSRCSGIVLRGASFAFRKYAATLAQARLFGVVFAGSSLIAPFFLGAVAGAIASGRVPADGRGDLWSPPGSTRPRCSAGVIAVGTCAFLAGAFLAADAARAGRAALAEHAAPPDARRRRSSPARWCSPPWCRCERDAPTLGDGLTGRAAPLIVLSALAGVGDAGAAVAPPLRPGPARAVGRRRRGGRSAGASAQYPWLLVDEVTIADGAGAPATLPALLVVVGLAGVIVLPALVYLFWLTQSETWSVGH